jgi:hypothetical protein
MNDETRDQALSRLYREGAWPEPSRQIDQAILAASRRAARARHPFLWRFAPPFAIAATVVLTSAIVLKVYREQPDMLATTVQEKPSAALRATVEPKQKEVEQTPKPAAPAAPEPQAPATPQGFSSTMDTAEALRLERAQRDIGFKEPSPAGAAVANAAPKPLKKESSTPVEANRERRADAPQASTFSAFGASAPPAQAQTPQPAPAQAARAATGKPAQISTQVTPAPAPRPEAAQAAPSAEAAPAPQPQASPSLSVIGLQVGAAAAKVERTPQAWIDDIRKMMKEGKSEEAGEEIAKFKKRYPDYVLPEDLR